ncbi:MAG: nucleotidyltransferase family protein [Candidatus Methylomirabilota bacterium]
MHHICKLALFGSVLREDFRTDSDVDVLVEFEPGHVVGLRLIQMEEKLSRLLGEHKVDIGPQISQSQHPRPGPGERRSSLCRRMTLSISVTC